MPLVYVLIFVIINVFIPQIMNVIDVNINSYINYLLFMNAMLIFYLLLPTKNMNFD